MHWLQRGTRFKLVATAMVVVVNAILLGLALGSEAFVESLPNQIRNQLWTNLALEFVLALAVVWLNHTLTAVAFAVFGAAFAVPLYFLGQEHWSWAISAIASLIVAFLLLVELSRLALGGVWAPLAVARVFIDEALRMKIAVVFIGALIFLVPFISTQLDPDVRLSYRIQTFLSYGVGLSYAILAVMTLFLATATVAFEQRDKQIYQIVAKPISRFEYLIGKWIGVMTLNLVLLAIIGGAVFWSVTYLRTLPAKGAYDRLAVTEQVLTARVGVKPALPDFLEEARFVASEEVRLNPEIENTPQNVTELMQQEVKRLRTAALTVPAGDQKMFTFENVEPISRERTITVDQGEPFWLGDEVKTIFDIRLTSEDGGVVYTPDLHYRLARRDSETGIVFPPAGEQNTEGVKLVNGQRVRLRYFPASALTLRFKINTGENLQGVAFPLTFLVEDVYPQIQEVAPVQSQTMLIPAGLVNDDGTLSIRIVNGDLDRGQPNPVTISFPPDGLELMYKTSEFPPNYLRAMMVIWLKLGFLAMLGIAAAAIASFPVACLMAFTIFLAAETGEFLTEALEFVNPVDPVTQEINWIMWLAVAVAKPTSWLLGAYAEFRPTGNLIEGRLVSWTTVFRTLAVITGIWTGLALLAGWISFRTRQLALYSGHS